MSNHANPSNVVPTYQPPGSHAMPAMSTAPTSSFAPASEEAGVETEAFYLREQVFVTLQRAAAHQGATDWRRYARQRLDQALAAHALLLDPMQADDVRRYAAALDVAPEEALAYLLAPGLARRERRRRQVIAFAQRYHPRSPRGCLLPLVWGMALVFTCALGLIVLWLGLIVLHTLH